MTIASELLLLALDEESGRTLVDTTTLDLALAGTAVLELVLAGTLEVVAVDGGPVKKGRLRRTGQHEPADPLLVDIADVCDGKKPKDAISYLVSWTWHNKGTRLREQLLGELVDRGVLSYERSKVLGMFTRERWPEADPSVEGAVRERVGAVLVDGQQPDEPTAALVSMVSVTKLAPRLFPDQDGKELQRRADAVRESDWAATPVKQSIDELMMTMMVAVFVPVFITTTS
jgi:hypothetical protein